MRRLVLLALPLSLLACADSHDDTCERALDRVATCFPDHASAPVCDPETADAIADASCDEIASWEGKSDNPWCVWTPWLCSGGGGSSSSGRTVRVAVDECGPGPLCPYVVGASCSLVTLHDEDDRQVAKGLTNEHGNISFENLSTGTYTVKVRKRDNTLARMQASDYSDVTAPAKLEVTVDGGEERVYIHLTPGTGDAITQCANAGGDLTFEDASGAALDAQDAEWNWFVELETNGTVVDRTRALYIHPDRNTFMFRMLQKGAHTLRFVRMDIPSYEQRPNPDYARLRRLYSTDETPIEQTLTITSSHFGKDVDVSRTLVDPLAP